MMYNENIIELSEITKSYGSTTILKDICITIRRGDFISIVGQSGSGKSTLMNILGCLDYHYEGEYIINGISVKSLTKDQISELRCSTFGFIFQRYHLLSYLNAHENVALPSMYSTYKTSDRDEVSKSLLTSLGLGDRVKNTPQEMSGGQQQRVSIARALMNGAEIILADEPTGALDSKNGENVINILKDLNKQGFTIILVTHDKTIANQANRIIEIKDGQIVDDHRISAGTNVQKKHKVKAQYGKWEYIKYQFLNAVKISWLSLMAHKVRSLLTMFGIIIGNIAVITTLALGDKSQEDLENNIKRWGGESFVGIYAGHNWEEYSKKAINTISEMDIELLQQQDYIQCVIPVVQKYGTVVSDSCKEVFNSRLIGLNKYYIPSRNMSIIEGRNMNDEDVRLSAPVVILDKKFCNELFKGISPLGHIVYNDGIPFTVIGVSDNDPNSRFDSKNLFIYTPYTTCINRMLGTPFNEISINLVDGVDIGAAKSRIKNLLIQSHNAEDFMMRTNEEWVLQSRQSIMQARILMLSIALLIMLVAGIGIMNVMLMSVKERIKEIGIRMAIGAKQGHIMLQFLTESVIISVFSGGVGVFIAKLMQMVFMLKSNISYSLIAFLVSVTTGIVFGYIPAKNASKIDPIKALNDE